MIGKPPKTAPSFGACLEGGTFSETKYLERRGPICSRAPKASTNIGYLEVCTFGGNRPSKVFEADMQRWQSNRAVGGLPVNQATCKRLETTSREWCECRCREASHGSASRYALQRLCYVHLHHSCKAMNSTKKHLPD